MLKMKKPIILILTIFARHEAILASPSHPECSAALYKGLMEVKVVLQSQIPSLIANGTLSKSTKPTCIFATMLKELALKKFHESKCTWGTESFDLRDQWYTDYKNGDLDQWYSDGFQPKFGDKYDDDDGLGDDLFGDDDFGDDGFDDWNSGPVFTGSADLFERRFFSLFGEFIEGGCEGFPTAVGYDLSMCTPKEELFAAFNRTYTCMVKVARDVYQANGITEYGGLQDLCRDIENFGPCFEGIVDDCHNDDETSESILDALAATVTFFAKTLFPNLSLIDQLSTCANNTKHPNWLTSRVAGIPLDWTPSDKPMSDLVLRLALYEGYNEVKVNEDALNNFTKELYAMMKTINKKTK